MSKPLSPFSYFGYDLLYAVPIIGLIAMIRNATQKSRPDLRNYTLSKFIPFFIYGILIIGALIFVGVIYAANGFTW
jgi:hypothetical protein